jgi:hypothetical protein
MRRAPAAMSSASPGWRARFDALIAETEARDGETYFNEAVLGDAIAAVSVQNRMSN